MILLFFLKSRQIFCHYSLRLKKIIIILVCIILYTHKVISTILNLNTFRRKPFKFNSIDILKCNFSLAILFYLGHLHYIWTPQVVNNAELLPGGETIRLLETKSLSAYILIHNTNNNSNNMDTGVRQVGASAYQGKMNAPTYQSLGWCFWQASVTPMPPASGLQQKGSWDSIDHQPN